MMSRTVVGLALAAACSASVGEVTFKGLGVSTCGKFMMDRRDPQVLSEGAYGTWMLGFISAYNWVDATFVVKKIPDTDTLMLYMEKFCRDNPLGSVVQGTQALIYELRQAYTSP